MNLPSPDFATVRTVVQLRQQIASWRATGQKIAFVPTMGALHEGHLSLMRQGRDQADRVVVSIFVNPKQFNESEDFKRYPRDEARDRTAMSIAGADLLFAPDAQTMYPAEFGTIISVPALSRLWEGVERPGHFNGMITVVTKLLMQVAPDIALFGEKDYQQLQIVRRMVLDLDLPVKIVGCPTIRDEHGLALSSRNALLDAGQIKIARRLNAIIKEAARDALEGKSLKTVEIDAARTLQDSGFDRVDYFAFCDHDTLEPTGSFHKNLRIICAARIGNVRLLDNMPAA